MTSTTSGRAERWLTAYQAAFDSLGLPDHPAIDRGLRQVDYRIDDLAREAGTTSRNVRAYQERGLLPPAVRWSGRAAIYDETHLERLKIIDALLQRGFTTAHIADFITSWETGKDMSEVLGLQHAVTATWGETGSIDVPRELVDTFLGSDAGDLVDRLIELGLARAKDDDTITFTRPSMLEAFAELHTFGLQLRDVIDLYSDIARRVDDIARLMVDTARSHITAQHGPGWLPDTDEDIAATTNMISHMREIGIAAVHDTLASAMENTVATQLGEYLSVAFQKRKVETE